MANHSGLTVTMSREKESRPERVDYLLDGGVEPFTCDVCQRILFPGDWPFCKGNPADHQR